MRPTGQTFRIWLLASLCALITGTPQLASSQAGTRAGVSTSRSTPGEDVQSSEARGTRGTRETDARGSVLGAEEHAEVENQERRDLTEDPDPDSVEEHAEPVDGEEQEEEGQEPKDLPGAQEGSSSVTPQAISLPNAEGSIEGMGESFSPVLSSGTATFSVPIALPAGRAGVQPSLGLSYSSTNGNGVVGIGWGMGAPFISRQTDRGLPRYDDRDSWHAQEDRFIYNGGQELVPVNSTTMATVDASGLYNAMDAAAVPADVAGWQQYRARVEGGFMRFFRDPEGRRWVVQGKDGTRFDFGELPDMTGPPDLDSTFSLQSELGNGRGRIFMWHLTRMSDAHGSTVYYSYGESLGSNYLEDIYYVSPHGCADVNGNPDIQRECRARVSDYAAHVAITYDTNRPDRFSSYTTGWRTELTRRVRMITVTMAEAEVGMRYLVRRYHLAYDGRVHHSLLASVQVEGRPDAQVTNAPTGVMAVTPDTMVPETSLSIYGNTVGRLRPPMTFEYSQMPTGTAAGFGGVDNTVINVELGPDVSVDLADADLYDVNTDGLPDLIVTEPARYRTRDGRPAAGVFFNGFEGENTEPAGRAGVFSEPVPVPMRGDLSGIMRMRNANIVPMDVDGDGRGDLLHMPRLHSYGYFTPTREADETVSYSVRPAQQGWGFTYAEVELDRVGDDPRIDLVRDGTHYKMWDVNNDHLVDVVRTTGTVMQTWMNLGWAEGGEGRFGQATFNETSGAWELSTLPIETCLLHDGNPVDFSDPELRLADMNGDGIEDIVRIRRGRLVYWAGRGEALWGDGPATCGRNQGANRERPMESAPPELNPELSGVFMADINADGLSDVVQVRYNQLDVWFNVNGERFTPRQTFASPFAPDFSPNIRFADIDGSGTTDLVYGRAEQWKYMDLLGGVRPRLLTRVHNGLGATTTLTYASAAEDYTSDLVVADLCAGDCDGDEFQWSQVGPPRGKTLADAGPGDPACPWGDQLLFDLSGECVYRSGGSPVLSTVVRGVSTTDNFHLVGREQNITRSEFHYHEGYYEGIEQEFRGFGAADAVAIGDRYHGSQFTRTFFHQGRRPSDIATDRLAENPYEALKGRQWYTETYDDNGAYLATAHGTVVARNLITGQDGRVIWYAYVSQTDEFRYHHDQFVGADTARELPWLQFEGVNAAGEPIATEAAYTWNVPVRSATFAHIRGTTDTVDNVGNVHQQTAHGLQQDEEDSGPNPIYDAIVSHSVPTLLAGGRWLWRTSVQYLTGDNDHGMQLGHTTSTYDALTGDLETTVARAETGADLDFSGDSNGAAGYVLPSLQLVESSSTYDAWGSPVATCASANLHEAEIDDCLRYAEVEYDLAYAQLPLVERIAVDRIAGQSFCATTTAPFCMVETSAEWDRGFGVLQKATDPNDQVTRVAYDGLARLTAVTPPDFSDCAMTGVPVQTFQYDLVVDGLPVSRIKALQNYGSQSCSAPAYIESQSYVDGLGRARVALTRRDTSSWERSGIVVFNARGAAHLGFQNALTPGSGLSPSAALGVPAVPHTEARYDAFGRVIEALAEDGALTATFYGATSTKVCDALDMNPNSLFANTCTITRVDGHGRAYDQVLHQRRASQGYAHEYYRLVTQYRSDGAAYLMARGASESSAAIWNTTFDVERVLIRGFEFDSLGRRLISYDPDSTSRNSSTPYNALDWRYLFNDVGDLIAVRDPRGCGQNFYYDHAGRLIGEDYVECGEAMAAGDTPMNTLPTSAIAEGEIDVGTQYVDARYYFDEEPEFTGGALTTYFSPTYWVGRATGSVDRAQASAVLYDARGQAKNAVRMMAVLPEARSLDATLPADLSGTGVATTPSAGTQSLDYSNAYFVRTVYDFLGRPTATQYPENLDWDGGGVYPRPMGRIRYDLAGLPAGVDLEVRQGATLLYSTPVVREIEYDANRLPTRLEYGVATVTHNLHTQMEYDIRLRPLRSWAERDPTGATAPDLNAVTTVHDFRYAWDAVSNLREVRDDRNVGEWPAGYRPWRQTIDHDALYRVNDIHIDYHNDQGDPDVLQDDAATDWRAERTRTNADMSTHLDRDPMRTRPAPMVSSNSAYRVRHLEYDYDWLANMTSWTDDRDVFYERSAGQLTNGNQHSEFNAWGGGSYRPSALYLSTNIRDAGGGYSATDPRGGYVWLDYGDDGNVVAMTVHGQCTDVDTTHRCESDWEADFDERKEALEAGCVCAQEQHYRYDWDELNRLAEARRYDRTGGTGTWALAVQQRYRYDAGNVRMIKENIDHSPGGLAAVTVSPFPGDYERRGLLLDTANSTYVASTTLGTESQYTIGGARLVWGIDDAHTGDLTRAQRVTLSLSDLVQSTAAVVDLQSGELLEHTTFYPNGARETHRTTDEVSLQLEPIGFTGKEADEEVGLVYFGERYLIPRLGRWASVDPLSVHALGGGEALNGYHYVRGNLLQARDPLGLDSTEWDLFEGVVAGVLESGMAALDSATDLEGAVEAVKQYAEDVETAYERGGVVAALEEGNPILRSTRAVQEEVAAAEAAIERGDATAVGESLGRVVAAAAPFIPRRRGGRPGGRGDADGRPAGERDTPRRAQADGPPAADGPTQVEGPPDGSPDGSPSTEPSHPPAPPPSVGGGGSGGGSGGSSDARFVSQPNGELVDTHSTPPGSYDQPDGGRTDILQREDHGDGQSHTHDPNVNTNPRTGQTFVNGRDQRGRPVSARDVGNIRSGAAPRSPPTGRSR
jgi:RHS repeat-associated protein